MLGNASASRLSEVPREEEPPRPAGSADRDDLDAEPDAERDAEAEADREDREEDIFDTTVSVKLSFCPNVAEEYF